MGRHSRRGRPDTGKPTTTATGQRPAVRPAGREEAPRARPAPAPQRGGPRGTGPAYAPAGPPDDPAHGAPRVRGGHPEHREPGGNRGVPPQRGGAPGAGRGPAAGPPREAAHGAGRMPRQEYVEAFDDEFFGSAGARTGPAPGTAAPVRDAGDDFFGEPAPAPPGDREGAERGGARADDGDGEDGGRNGGDRDGRKDRGGRGRAFTGVAAAAVTTVLAVVVAGQVADPRGGVEPRPGANGDSRRTGAQDISRSDVRPTPSRTPGPAGAAGARQPAGSAPYADRMGRLFDLAADFRGSGRLVAVAGREKAPGPGQRVRYRVDVEDGLPLDGELFAEAVHRTLNDDRSWSHGGARTFERVPGDADADFVITLASPSTTAEWCARSGLDTTVDNVSCDSASTERIMINAYRWARGSRTFGPDRIREYREMLINHEVGHRLGKGHVVCPEDGALAPVMMQQTKYLTVGGATCRPNAWPFPDA